MGMQLNIGDHRSPFEASDGYIALPPRHFDVARWARKRAGLVAAGMPGANVYFKTLPGGRSLSALLADREIWINYIGTWAHWGEMRNGTKEVAIYEKSFAWGRWSVLATLVHELAHVNGAPSEGTEAELAVLACGLGTKAERDTGVDDPKTPYMPGLNH